MNNRIPKLLELCAKNLENGCEPLNHAFLCKHNVTIHECQELADQMAVAIKAYIRTPLKERVALIVRACVGGGFS